MKDSGRRSKAVDFAMAEFTSNTFVGDPAEMAECAFQQWHNDVRKGSNRLVEAGFWMLLIGVANWFAAPPFPGTLALLFLAGYKFYRGINTRRLTKQMFLRLYRDRKMSDLLGSQTLTVSEKGIANDLESGASMFVPWALFRTSHFSDQAVVVLGGPHYFNLPKRAFSPEEWPSIVEFVRTKVPQERPMA